MRSERQALADIAAEPVQRIDPDALGWISAEHVHAILADVQPEPAPVDGDVLMPPETLLERVKADVRLWNAGVAAGRQDAPAGGTIDRISLDVALHLLATGNSSEAETRDRVLALVRPASGVVLTPEEAHAAAGWYTGDLRGDGIDELALAERLEAAS